MISSNSSSRADFEARIASSSKDSAALAEIEAKLRGISAGWAGALRLRVIDARRKLSTPPPPWGSRFGLPPPDGRPLYLYRLTNAAFDALTSHLRRESRADGFTRPHDEAFFVLWAAEWFRRDFDGGVRRWQDLGGQLGLRLEQAGWRSLADQGLDIWKIAPLMLHGAKHRLLNLARHGGFPLAATRNESAGWAGAYLQKLVGALLAAPDPTTDFACDRAEQLRTMVPPSWHSSDFFLVSADLALAVVRLRREAQATKDGIAGIAVSAWLDVNRPDWRSELPLVVEDDAGRTLIDGLMAATVARSVGEVRASRALHATDIGWRPKLRLELNGTLRQIDMQGLQSMWTRLRMFASGSLARYVPGELAVVEPDDADWVAVGSTAATRAFDVPLETPVEVELRGGGQRVSAGRLANGEPIGASLLICQPEADATEAIPRCLLVVGTASGKHRADPLYVFAPSTWTLAPGQDGETIEDLESTWEGRRLWRVSAGAIATSDRGDRYRILAGQSSDERDRLIVEGEPPAHCQGSASMQIAQGRPRLVLRERGRDRAPQGGEAWWRRPGEREWRPLEGFDGLGHCELAWRDRETRHLRDRADVIVVPPEFCIDLRRRGEHVDLAVRGWPGSIDVRPGTPAEGRGWVFRTRGAQEAIALVRLSTPRTAPVELAIRLPHQPWIVEWTGRPLEHRERFALADMHGLVARADGHAHLLAQLRDRDGRRIDHAECRWAFELELPLNAIRDDVAALLRPLGELDASVELTFAGVGERHWFACEFDLRLDKQPHGLVTAKALDHGDARLAGRALCRPQAERDLGPYGAAPIELEEPGGPWLLYVRAGAHVLSRPCLVPGRPTEEVSDRLARAMLVVDKHARIGALEDLCADAETAPAGEGSTLRTIIDLIASLHGLPPSTFDLLCIVASRPGLAARLIFEAMDNEIEMVAALTAGLPFAWPLVAKRHWDAAAQLRFDAVFDLLGMFPEPERSAFAIHSIKGSRRRILDIEPALATAFGEPTPAFSLADAAQRFMHLTHDQPQTSQWSPFRPRHAALLPSWQFSGTFWCALDAPCAAALAAAEKMSLKDAELRCVKDIARRHPRWFEEAFAATSKDISNGRRPSV